MKACTKCGVVTDQYYKDKSQPDGRTTWCKPCRADYQRSYFARNKDELAKKRVEYRAKNRAHHNELQRRWVRRNPEMARAVDVSMRAKRRATISDGVSSDVFRQWEAASPKECFYCREDCSDGWHVDHFVPLSRGGTHVLTNLRISCPTCNIAKSARDPMEWIDMIQQEWRAAA